MPTGEWGLIHDLQMHLSACEARMQLCRKGSEGAAPRAAPVALRPPSYSASSQSTYPCPGCPGTYAHFNCSLLVIGLVWSQGAQRHRQIRFATTSLT